jgi:hypothetical protein
MSQPGYVYVMRLEMSTEAEQCAYKIGKSVKPVARLTQLSTKLPYPVSLLLVIRTGDMQALEQMLHARYSATRMEGEWFRLTLRDLRYLVRLAGGTGEGCVCWDYHSTCEFFDICHPDS